MRKFIIGEILPIWRGSEVPEGFLHCDGRAVSRIIFSELFGVVGVSYGKGDGHSTFNLPNLDQKGDITKRVIFAGTDIVSRPKWCRCDAQVHYVCMKHLEKQFVKPEERDKRFCEEHSDYHAFIEVIECNNCNFYLKD